MARFRRRRRRGFMRVRRIKPRAYFRRGRVKKAATRLSKLRKGADTIVTRVDTFANDVFESELSGVRFNSFILLGYCPYGAQSGLIVDVKPTNGWLGLSGRFRALCDIYDAFKINYITFDVEVATPSRFNTGNYITSRTEAMGYYDREIILGVLVDRCRPYAGNGIFARDYAKFWTDPATIITHTSGDKCPRIKVTVSPRAGEYSPWFECPSSWSSSYFPEFANKSIVSGFLPFFYYGVRIGGDPDGYQAFLSEYVLEHVTSTEKPKLPLRLKVSYGITFRGSLSGSSIASAKVASIVEPTEHMEEFALKDEVTEVPVTNVQ